MASAQDLARTFSRLLWADLTVGQMETVIERNRVDGANSGVCHSHDFCDANMVMAEAFDACCTPVFNDAGEIPEATAQLWDEAWGLAKKSEFATS
jgi:hypothetical protein